MNQRLRQTIDFLKEGRRIYSDAEFARKVGIDKAELSKMLSGTRTITQRFVDKVLAQFPDLNKDWLMTGAGEMLKSYPQAVTTALSAEEGSTVFIGDKNKVNTDQTIAMLVAEVAAQRRVTEKVLEQNSELLAMIAANNKR